MSGQNHRSTVKATLLGKTCCFASNDLVQTTGVNGWTAVPEPYVVQGSTNAASRIPGGWEWRNRRAAHRREQLLALCRDVQFGRAAPRGAGRFDARRAKTSVSCTWATASAKHNARFVVERSANGETFAAIGTVEGSGSTASARAYSFVDARPLAGTTYYRLQQVDVDGTLSHSPVVTVAGPATDLPAVSAVPNPGNGHFAVWATLLTPASLQGAVLNVLSEKVLTINEQLPAGSMRLTLDLSAQPAGIYVVQLHGLDSPVSLRVVKQQATLITCALLLGSWLILFYNNFLASAISTKATPQGVAFVLVMPQATAFSYSFCCLAAAVSLNEA
jgi:hypothetical protein